MHYQNAEIKVIGYIGYTIGYTIRHTYKPCNYAGLYH